MTNRTQYFTDAVQAYRNKLRGIWADYDEKMRRLEQYKGSKGYDKDKAKADAERDAAISALQDTYRETLFKITDRMRESATTREMIAPTQEQLALLQALQMREKIDRNELEQAGRTLKDCPVALSVLDEIATKQEIYGLRFTSGSTSGILDHINALEESAKRLCKLQKCNSRYEMGMRSSIYNPNHEHNAMYSFRIDKDVESVADTMELFGGIDANALPYFEDAVNN